MLQGFIRACPLALLLISALALPHHAAASPITVDLVQPWMNDRGYTPIDVTLSVDGPHTFTLKVDCDGRTATERVEVAAGVHRRQLLLPPASTNPYCTARMRWSTQDGQHGEVYASTARTARPSVITVGDASRAEGIPDEVLLSPDALPERWQGLPSASRIVLTEQADPRLSPARRRALLFWALAGGDLAVDTAAQQDAWLQAGAYATVFDRDNAFSRPALEEVRDANGDPGFAPTVLHIPGTEEVPVAGFIWLVLTFAVLVGPVNILRNYRAGKRHRLLITTPLFSLAAIVLLVSYNLVAEGLGTRRIASELTWLDSTNHHAMTWQGVTWFAAMGQDTFALDGQTRVLDLARDTHEHALESRGVNVVWEGGQQRLEGGVVPARVNRQLTFLTPRAERRRLTLRADGDGFKLLNGTDRRIAWLSWTEPGPDPGDDINNDPDPRPGARQWIARDIGAGDSVALALQSSPLDAPSFQSLGAAAQDAWWWAGTQPGYFTAHLSGPLHGLHGPEAEDMLPTSAWLMGPLTTDGGAP